MVKIKNPMTIVSSGGSATLVSKTITANGQYNPADDNADGYSDVSVSVDAPAPVLISKSITQNGTYDAQDDNADGYKNVTVAVPAPTNKFKSLVDRSITSVTAEDLAGVTSIGSGAFQNCTGFTSVTIPDSVTDIWYNAFSGCTGLTSVTIPNSVTSIGSYAFSGCTSLTNINIPTGITDINTYTFYYCAALTNITIPQGLISIGDYAFKDCHSISNIDIPDSVTIIGADAFKRCNSAKTIVIGSGILNIGVAAFQESASIEKAVIKAINPPTLGNAVVFTSYNPYPIYCPYASIDTYKAATNWTTYASRIFPLVATVADLTNIDTTTYTKACVTGADESYKEYTYDGSDWNPVS